MEEGEEAPPTVIEGEVDGVHVQDILVDTGAARTMVHSGLVADEKLVEQGAHIFIRCAHGDLADYPVARVTITVGGKSYPLFAAVSGSLPVSVLLGRDLPGLVNLLQRTGPTAEVLVMTRAQKRQHQRKEAELAARNSMSGAQTTPIEFKEAESEGEPFGAEFAEDLFSGGRPKPHLTRRQKRQHNAQVVQQKDQANPLDISAAEMKELQEMDGSLAAVRLAARGQPSTVAGTGFLERDGLLLRRWKPAGSGDLDREVEQLVLSVQCRKAVLQLAHQIPLAGHLGRQKTAQRILQRFYWPSLFKDVADFCKSCSECQKTSPGQKLRAPLIPLPVVEEPFQRIAMDIVGPLPKSRAGHRYILVICDYATRYPEAVPLRSIDATHVAEELMKVFARVGIPQEILTDQGANFTSQLLREVYRLLHVQPIRTSPYHPQTDGLVERFNQTLKAMLRRAATDEGRDWDKLIPYLLFAYREVPQASTGFSPFELLYGRAVRGPLDILKECWEASSKSSESIVSYVLTMQEKLAKMSELA